MLELITYEMWMSWFVWGLVLITSLIQILQVQDGEFEGGNPYER